MPRSDDTRATVDIKPRSRAVTDGIEATTTEGRALLALPVAALDALAGAIDPRLQRLAVPR